MEVHSEGAREEGGVGAGWGAASEEQWCVPAPPGPAGAGTLTSASPHCRKGSPHSCLVSGQVVSPAWRRARHLSSGAF